MSFPRRPSTDPRTVRRIEELKAFHLEHVRNPVQSDNKGLYMWLQFQRRADINGNLTPSIRTALDAEVPLWKGKVGGRRTSLLTAEELRSNLHALKAALEASGGRIPDHRTPLGAWTKMLRMQISSGKISVARLELIQEILPGWDPSRNTHDHDDGKFALAVKEYRDATGKWPTGRNTDPRISALGSKLSNARTAARNGSIRKAVKVSMDTNVPGWLEEHTGNWEKTLQEVVQFIEINGQRPRDTSNDPTEKWLGRWLKDQRTRRNVTAEREAFLDAGIPDWRQGLPQGLPQGRPSSPEPGTEWRMAADSVAQFVDENGRMPSKNSEAETPLISWLYMQRMHLRKGRLSDDKTAWLDQNIPGWPGVDRAAAWKVRADAFIVFVGRTGECPKRSLSGKGDQTETKLKIWIDGTRDQHRRGVMSAARMEYMDAHGPSWWRGDNSETVRQ